MSKIEEGKKAPDFSLEHDLTVQEALLQASGMASGVSRLLPGT